MTTHHIKGENGKPVAITPVCVHEGRLIAIVYHRRWMDEPGQAGIVFARLV